MPVFRSHFDGQSLFLAVLGGSGLFFGLPNPVAHMPALTLLAPFCLYLLGADAGGGKRAFARGWLLGLCGQTAALYWLTIPMHEVGELPMALAIPAVMLLTSYLSLYYGLACTAMVHARRLFGVQTDDRQRPARPAALCAALPAALLGGLAFGGCEVLCGTVFTGFPWLSTATAFVPWVAWIQGASLVGSYGLGAVLAAGACLLAEAVLGAGARRLVAAVAGLCLLAALPAFGHWRLRGAPEASGGAGETLVAAMVQGNIDQNQKWEPVFQEATVAHYMNLTVRVLEKARALPDPKRVDVVIWPETAMPFYYQNSPGYVLRLRDFAAKHRVNLAFGTLAYKRDQGRILLFNRFQAISSSGLDAGHYDKQHLVPFGEYVPFNLNLGFISNILQGMQFSPGEVETPMSLPLGDPLAEASMPASVPGEPAAKRLAGGERLALGALICYECIFPRYAQARVAGGAEVLVNISNDAWFGRSSSPDQHLDLAVMRAVEQARPLLRATNTGYTAQVDAFGRVIQEGGLFDEEVFLAALRPASGTTVYHCLYPWVEVLLVAACAIALGAYRLRNTL